jgi:hypothetical protein
MRIKNQVPFAHVREVFLRENPDMRFGSTDYALGLLEVANQQLEGWYEVLLSAEDILGVMLPPHRHEGLNLIPESGLVVSDALKKLELAPQSHVCPQKIERLSREPVSTVFLSDAPIDHPKYPDYRELVRRHYKGLTHLDGLHRLLSWARSGQSGILAFVAARTK